MRPASFTRLMAECENNALNCGCCISRTCSGLRLRISFRGANSSIWVGSALLLCGHTFWHWSQPYRRFPLAFTAQSGNCSPRYSMSRHDKHRDASTAPPSWLNAPPGQASTQRWQSPQQIRHGSSGSSDSVVTISPKKKYDPRPGNMRRLLRPINPIPARCAQYFSRMGAVSTHTLHSAWYCS